jgi:hypothetical protein
MEDDELKGEDFVILATKRDSFADALRWLSEGHPMPPDTSWSRLLMELVPIVKADEVSSGALRRVVKEAARSEVDSARVLFDPASIPSPNEFRNALDELVRQSDGGSLSTLSPRGVLNAQYANSRSIETLCLAVGVTYSDAIDWFGVGSGGWKLEQVEQLMEYFGNLLNGAIEVSLKNSIPGKAIELLGKTPPGWEPLDNMRINGVPYEVLLAQRSVGGPWLAHKNKTSNVSNIAAAESLSVELKRRGIKFLKASTVGGDVRQIDLQTLSGIPKKQVGLVVLSSDAPVFAVAFSSARDGGTARANGDGLMQIPQNETPLALFLTGLGWSPRPETDRLARRFSGRIFTELTVLELADLIEAAL